MTDISIALLAVVVQLGALPATTTSPSDTSSVVLETRLSPDKVLEVVKIPPTSNSTSIADRIHQNAIDGPSTRAGDSLLARYIVRVAIDGRPDRTVLWEFDRQSNPEFSSERMRYRVLAAVIVGEYLVIAEKIALGTSVVLIRPGDETRSGALLQIKYLQSDSEADGPVVTSAKFDVKTSLADSWLILNPDAELRHQRRFSLADCFPNYAK